MTHVEEPLHRREGAVLKIREVLLATTVAAALLACRAPEPVEPPVAIFTARTANVIRLLDRIARLEGTRLGHTAAALRATLPDCRALGAWVAEPDLPALLEGVRCVDQDPRLTEFDRTRGNHDLALEWPLGGALRAQVRLALDRSDDADIEILIPADAARGATALLVPGPVSPGPPRLAGTDTLLHARMRPRAGIDVAALVSDDSQAERLFHLKSRIFAGAVLDGTWEAALYMPQAGDTVPPLALALGFQLREGAVAAIEELIEDVRESWPVTRTDFSVEGASGACLPDLRLMPGLAPCYVATQNALVVGWNDRSVVRALSGGPAELRSVGGVLLELSRLAEADTNLTGDTPPSADLPWTRIHAVGREEKDGVRLRVQLAASRGA